MSRAEKILTRIDEAFLCKRGVYPNDPLREEIERITIKGLKILPCPGMKAISFALYELVKHHKLDQIIGVIRDVETASEKHQFHIGAI